MAFYEHKIWQLGEELRAIFKENKKFNKKNDFLDEVLKIALNTNAKRGRQPFIMLLGCTACSIFAKLLITQINDKFVSGHIIQAIYKMKVPDFVEEIKPFCKAKVPWIQQIANQYVEKYDCQT
jgi:hypothetical protein